MKIFNKMPQLLLLLMDRFQQISTYMEDIQIPFKRLPKYNNLILKIKKL